MINGRMVDSQNLERIKISYSDEPSSELLELIELENTDRGVPIFDRLRLARQVAERARDVTAQVLSTAPPTADRRKVFLVRGRWEAAAQAMRDFLRALDLDVIGWDEARLQGKEGQHNADILDAGFSMAYAVVVFMTPDDVAALHPVLAEEHDKLTGQPRPNVLFEAGYAWHAIRERTLIVEFGDLKKLSNLSGVDRVRFDGSPKARGEVADRLKSINVAVKTEGGAYLQTGKFPAPLPEVTADDLGLASATDLLNGIPLHWVLLARLRRGQEIDIAATAAQAAVSTSEVRKALTWLMTKGFAQPLGGHLKAQAAANGACRITGDGLTQLDAETRLSQS